MSEFLFLNLEIPSSCHFEDVASKCGSVRWEGEQREGYERESSECEMEERVSRDCVARQRVGVGESADSICERERVENGVRERERKWENSECEMGERVSRDYAERQRVGVCKSERE